MKVFVVLTVLAIVGTATAIKCFVCNSKNDANCKDGTDFSSQAVQDEFLVECQDRNESLAFCRVSTAYIERVDTTDETRVWRECGYLERENFICYRKRAEDYTLITCQCYIDMCNSAPALTTSVAFVVALTLPFFTRFL